MEILLSKDINDLCIIDIGIINRYKLKIYYNNVSIFESLSTDNQYKINTEDGKYIVKEMFSSIPGLISFEFIYNNKSKNPNGFCSSNSSDFYKYSNIKTIPVIVNELAIYHMYIDEAKKLIPDNYEILYIPGNISYGGNNWEIIKKEDIYKYNIRRL